MSATATTVKTYPAYFAAAGNGEFEPTDSAAGYWGEGQLSGPAVAGLAASALETALDAGHGDPDFQPGLASLVVGIAALGGVVDLDTEPGSGTTVTVTMSSEPVHDVHPLDGGTGLILPIPGRG